MDRVYLDHAATTRVDPEVAETMSRALRETHGNTLEHLAFPKTQTGYDPLLDAPAAADPKLLEELGLRVIRKPGMND